MERDFFLHPCSFPGPLAPNPCSAQVTGPQEQLGAEEAQEREIRASIAYGC